MHLSDVLPLYVLSSFITLVCVIYTFDDMPEAGNPKAFLILMLVLQTGMAGTFVAQDLILFFVFFEVVLLPMYFLIGVWGGEQRQYASLKFFLYTMFGSALMLVAFLALFAADGRRELRRSPTCRARPAIGTHGRSGSSPACSSASPSRCRCSRSTPGFPTPTPRRPQQGSVILAADPAEARHLRLRAHRHPVPAGRGQGVGAGHRRPRRHRHHLRRARLSGADGHEAADRVLVGRPHGLRHARHLDAHRRSASTPRCSAWSPTA